MERDKWTWNIHELKWYGLWIVVSEWWPKCLVTSVSQVKSMSISAMWLHSPHTGPPHKCATSQRPVTSSTESNNLTKAFHAIWSLHAPWHETKFNQGCWVSMKSEQGFSWETYMAAFSKPGTLSSTAEGDCRHLCWGISICLKCPSQTCSPG